MFWHFLIIIVIIIVFGILGGVINFISSEVRNTKVFPKPDLRKSLIFGVTASFLVPLFLNMISSSILKDSVEDVYQLFVFAGFCLIASISSKAFINSISQKLLDQFNDIQTKNEELTNRVDEVDKVITPKIMSQLNNVQTEHAQLINKVAEVDKIVSPMVEKESEGEIPESKINFEDTKTVQGYVQDNDSDEIKILKALAYDKYTFRTLSGISISTGISTEAVNIKLAKLINEQLVDYSKRQDGMRFFITSQGRCILNEYPEDAQVEV